MSTQTTTTVGFHSDTIDYVTTALGDFAGDFDIVAIAHQVFDWVPSLDAYQLTVDEDGFWAAVASHEVTA